MAGDKANSNNANNIKKITNKKQPEPTIDLLQYYHQQ